MASVAGLMVAVVLALVAAWFIPYSNDATNWRLVIVASVPLVNIIVWWCSPILPVSPRQARAALFIGAATLLVLAAFDVLIGFITGHRRSLLDAFMGSGIGAALDIGVATLAIFVGIPTLVRAMLRHQGRMRRA
jgi:hypothetical protein